MNHIRNIGYKGQSNLPQFIVYSIISAVIFLIIYSIWFDPTFVSSTITKGQEIVSSGLGKVSPSTSNNEFRCEEDIRKEIRIAKVQSSSDSTIKVIERGSFEDIHEAIAFVEEWGASNSYVMVKHLQSQFNPHFSDIQLVLIRSEGELCIWGYCEHSVRLNFGVCEDIGKDNKLYIP